MPVSRRGFLETGALSASGLVLARFIPQENGSDAAQQQGAILENDAFHRQSDARTVLSMNSGWQFCRPSVSRDLLESSEQQIPPADAKWESATLPHTVRLEPRDVSGGRNYQGLCWYQRQFAAQPEWMGRIVYLKFQGAMQVADIWLNGNHLMTHYGGYTPFTLDISKAIRSDAQNTLLVRLDNRDNPEVPPGKPQDELDFCYFGGLYRSVDLEVRDRLHITDAILADKVAGGGVFVTFPKVSRVESIIHIQTDCANEHEQGKRCIVGHKLMELSGELVASSSADLSIGRGESAIDKQEIRVQAPRLWHPDDPHLYVLHTTISVGGRVSDEEFTRIGIRSIHFEKEKGLLINGQSFFSVGANRHQDHPYVGYALPPSAHYRDVYKLREAGFTSYRSHYPQDPSFMDACDQLGMLAIVSNPGWQFIGGDVFKKRVFRDAREMIRRDRNHPCVIIWEAALNESDNHSIAAELYRIVHEEYPGECCYTAGDPIRRPVEGFHGWDVDYVGNRSSRPDGPSWIREWGDQVDNWTDQQGRVRVARSWGETPMLVQAAAHLSSLDRVCKPETRPAGADLWAGIDAFRGYHHQPFQGAPLDLFRLPKFDHYMFQSQRSPDAKEARVGHGPMVFIANFGTFQSPGVVTVFSNCEQVRLTQNGKQVATQEPNPGHNVPHPPFTFKAGDFSETRDMLYGNPTTQSTIDQPVGQLLAEGLLDGKVVASHLIQSPGVPTRIRLHLDTCGLDPVADGADWMRVYAHICDERGTTHPFADDMVTFTAEGEGMIIGDEAIFANPVRAEAGIATALIRTTGVPGTITVRASAPGLVAAYGQFASIPNPKRALL